MSYLEKYIGKVITVQITSDALDDKMIQMFFPTPKNRKFIGGKLDGVDELGVWLEGKVLFKNEERTASVLIPHRFIVNVCRINGEEPPKNGEEPLRNQIGFL
jgi:hypothetical protein